VTRNTNGKERWLTSYLISLFCLLAVLGLWQWSLGSISVQTVNTPKAETFYWGAITFSQTLGTALGDWIADSGLGYEGGALFFGAALALVAALYFWTSVSHVTLFWVAFILTRPLGATVGDLLDKPASEGGLALSRPIASAVIRAFIIACLICLPQRAGRGPVPQTSGLNSIPEPSLTAWAAIQAVTARVSSATFYLNPAFEPARPLSKFMHFYPGTAVMRLSD